MSRWSSPRSFPGKVLTLFGDVPNNDSKDTNNTDDDDTGNGRDRRISLLRLALTGPLSALQQQDPWGYTLMHYAVMSESTTNIDAVHAAVPGLAVVPSSAGRLPLQLALERHHHHHRHSSSSDDSCGRNKSNAMIIDCVWKVTESDHLRNLRNNSGSGAAALQTTSPLSRPQWCRLFTVALQCHQFSFAVDSLYPYLKLKEILPTTLLQSVHVFTGERSTPVGLPTPLLKNQPSDIALLVGSLAECFCAALSSSENQQEQSRSVGSDSSKVLIVHQLTSDVLKVSPALLCAVAHTPAPQWAANLSPLAVAAKMGNLEFLQIILSHAASSGSGKIKDMHVDLTEGLLAPLKLSSSSSSLPVEEETSVAVDASLLEEDDSFYAKFQHSSEEFLSGNSTSRTVSTSSWANSPLMMALRYHQTLAAKLILNSVVSGAESERVFIFSKKATTNFNGRQLLLLFHLWHVTTNEKVFTSTFSAKQVGYILFLGMVREMEHRKHDCHYGPKGKHLRDMWRIPQLQHHHHHQATPQHQSSVSNDNHLSSAPVRASSSSSSSSPSLSALWAYGEKHALSFLGRYIQRLVALPSFLSNHSDTVTNAADDDGPYSVEHYYPHRLLHGLASCAIESGNVDVFLSISHLFHSLVLPPEYRYKATVIRFWKTQPWWSDEKKKSLDWDLVRDVKANLPFTSALLKSRSLKRVFLQGPEPVRKLLSVVTAALGGAHLLPNPAVWLRAVEKGDVEGLAELVRSGMLDTVPAVVQQAVALGCVWTGIEMSQQQLVPLIDKGKKEAKNAGSMAALKGLFLYALQWTSQHQQPTRRNIKSTLNYQEDPVVREQYRLLNLHSPDSDNGESAPDDDDDDVNWQKKKMKKTHQARYFSDLKIDRRKDDGYWSHTAPSMLPVASTFNRCLPPYSQAPCLYKPGTELFGIFATLRSPLKYQDLHLLSSSQVFSSPCESLHVQRTLTRNASDVVEQLVLQPAISDDLIQQCVAVLSGDDDLAAICAAHGPYSNRSLAFVHRLVDVKRLKDKQNFEEQQQRKFETSPSSEDEDDDDAAKEKEYVYPNSPVEKEEATHSSGMTWKASLTFLLLGCLKPTDPPLHRLAHLSLGHVKVRIALLGALLLPGDVFASCYEQGVLGRLVRWRLRAPRGVVARVSSHMEDEDSEAESCCTLPSLVRTLFPDEVRERALVAQILECGGRFSCIGPRMPYDSWRLANKKALPLFPTAKIYPRMHPEASEQSLLRLFQEPELGTGESLDFPSYFFPFTSQSCVPQLLIRRKGWTKAALEFLLPATTNWAARRDWVGVHFPGGPMIEPRAFAMPPFASVVYREAPLDDVLDRLSLGLRESLSDELTEGIRNARRSFLAPLLLRETDGSEYYSSSREKAVLSPREVWSLVKKRIPNLLEELPVLTIIHTLKELSQSPSSRAREMLSIVRSEMLQRCSVEKEFDWQKEIRLYPSNSQDGLLSMGREHPNGWRQAVVWAARDGHASELVALLKSPPSPSDSTEIYHQRKVDYAKLLEGASCYTLSGPAKFYNKFALNFYDPLWTFSLKRKVLETLLSRGHEKTFSLLLAEPSPVITISEVYDNFALRYFPIDGSMSPPGVKSDDQDFLIQLILRALEGKSWEALRLLLQWKQSFAQASSPQPQCVTNIVFPSREMQQKFHRFLSIPTAQLLWHAYQADIVNPSTLKELYGAIQTVNTLLCSTTGDGEKNEQKWSFQTCGQWLQSKAPRFDLSFASYGKYNAPYYSVDYCDDNENAAEKSNNYEYLPFFGSPYDAKSQLWLNLEGLPCGDNGEVWPREWIPVPEMKNENRLPSPSAAMLQQQGENSSNENPVMMTFDADTLYDFPAPCIIAATYEAAGLPLPSCSREMLLYQFFGNRNDDLSSVISEQLHSNNKPYLWNILRLVGCDNIDFTVIDDRRNGRGSESFTVKHLAQLELPETLLAFLVKYRPQKPRMDELNAIIKERLLPSLLKRIEVVIEPPTRQEQTVGCSSCCWRSVVEHNVETQTLQVKIFSTFSPSSDQSEIVEQPSLPSKLQELENVLDCLLQLTKSNSFTPIFDIREWSNLDFNSKTTTKTSANHNSSISHQDPDGPNIESPLLMKSVAAEIVRQLSIAVRLSVEVHHITEEETDVLVALEKQQQQLELSTQQRKGKEDASQGYASLHFLPMSAVERAANVVDEELVNHNMLSIRFRRLPSTEQDTSSNGKDTPNAPPPLTPIAINIDSNTPSTLSFLDVLQQIQRQNPWIPLQTDWRAGFLSLEAVIPSSDDDLQFLSGSKLKYCTDRMIRDMMVSKPYVVAHAEESYSDEEEDHTEQSALAKLFHPQGDFNWCTHLAFLDQARDHKNIRKSGVSSVSGEAVVPFVDPALGRHSCDVVAFRPNQYAYIYDQKKDGGARLMKRLIPMDKIPGEIARLEKQLLTSTPEALQNELFVKQYHEHLKAVPFWFLHNLVTEATFLVRRKPIHDHFTTDLSTYEHKVRAPPCTASGALLSISALFDEVTSRETAVHDFLHIDVRKIHPEWCHVTKPASSRPFWHPTVEPKEPWDFDMYRSFYIGGLHRKATYGSSISRRATVLCIPRLTLFHTVKDIPIEVLPLELNLLVVSYASFIFPEDVNE